MALIGYALVSTAEHDTALQTDALRKAGCERVFEDTASGAKADRPGLADALAYLRDGDVLTSIAGRPVTGADAFDTLASQYPQGGNVPITVERGGQPVQLSITIAPPQ